MKPDRRFVERLIVSLGRLLPGEARRRIFEPAFYDMVREQLAADAKSYSRWSLVLRAMKLAFGSLGYGLTHISVNRRIVKRFLIGSAVVTALIAIVSAIILRDWISQIVRY